MLDAARSFSSCREWLMRCKRVVTSSAIIAVVSNEPLQKRKKKQSNVLCLLLLIGRGRAEKGQTGILVGLHGAAFTGIESSTANARREFLKVLLLIWTCKHENLFVIGKESQGAIVEGEQGGQGTREGLQFANRPFDSCSVVLEHLKNYFYLYFYFFLHSPPLLRLQSLQ